MEYLTFAATVVALLMAGGQFLLRNRTYRNTMVGFLFLNVALLVGNAFLFYSGLLFQYPHLNHLHIPFMFLSAPALYIFFQMKMDENFHVQLSTLLHFIPAIVATISLIPFFLESAAEKAERLMRLVDMVDMSWPILLYFMSALILLAYQAVMIKKSLFLFRWEILRAETSAQIIFHFLLWSALACTLLNLTFIFRDLIWMEYANIIFSFVIIGMNLVSRRYPEFFIALQTVVEEARYAKDLIKDINLDELHERLVSLMAEDKLYLQEDITLGEVSQRLAISSHQLSQYLNERLTKNFSTYVNEFRIEDAQHMIRYSPDKTVLSIAYEVGFNSKSAFNKAFRKITEMTPTEYRKSLQN